MKFKDVNHALPALSHRLLTGGDEVGTRQGDRALEKLHQQVELEQPWNRYILLGRRRASLPAQIAETIWVLSGRNDVTFIEPYLRRAPQFSDDGKVWRGGYGPRLRSWERRAEPGDVVDQFRHVYDLIRGDALTRRAVATIYDPDIDTNPGKDIPCNNWLTFNSRKGYLHMHVATRSNDLIWGWSGINQFEWSAMQEILAGLLGIDVGVATYSISSLHAYERHWTMAGDLARVSVPPESSPSPRFSTEGWLNPGNSVIDEFDRLLESWRQYEQAIRKGQCMPEAARLFPEPMLRSWLLALGYYWSDDEAWLEGLEGTAIATAARLSPKHPRFREEQVNTEFVNDRPATPFKEYVGDLHEKKDAAYGDSWKRRGEMLGILSNIARKVDRLGKTDDQETALDTAIDLLVYLLKYQGWLYNHTAPEATMVRQSLDALSDERILVTPTTEDLINSLNTNFDSLEATVNASGNRKAVVERMITLSYTLAIREWNGAA